MSGGDSTSYLFRDGPVSELFPGSSLTAVVTRRGERWHRGNAKKGLSVGRHATAG